jgi:predicted amidophosphoribosyltransferase
MQRHWEALKSAALDVLFSRTCEGCGAAMTAEPARFVGIAGAKSGSVQVPFCERCAIPSPARRAAVRMRRVPAHGTRLRLGRSAVRYDGVAKACIRRFKYNAGIWLEDELTDWLEALWRTCRSPPARSSASPPCRCIPSGSGNAATTSPPCWRPAWRAARHSFRGGMLRRGSPPEPKRI